MDLNTIIGTLATFSIVLLAMAMGPGGVGIFVDIPSVAMVFGGTLGVTMLAFPGNDLKPFIKIMLITAMRKKVTPTEEIDRIVSYANLARKEGLLALETKLQTVDDTFFAKGIQLVIDGFGADTVRDIMELEAEWEKQRHDTGRKIMDQMGAFAPAFGMIGTLVGLVQMLQDLSDPASIGTGMATALLTTLYGAMGANMVFIPVAGKLEMVSKQSGLIRSLMIEGIVAIQSGEKPQLIKEKLKGFLAPSLRDKVAA
ncbi:MAG: motility protein A [Planctomycetes bacterium]|nr:motility protein A [Planctomycetota bacterium]MCB9909984.1 motility protein A [Planctomycetota bacterium]HPF12718.1 motility protein A [Planctomycetota bacterium]